MIDAGFLPLISPYLFIVIISGELKLSGFSVRIFLYSLIILPHLFFHN